MQDPCLYTWLLLCVGLWYLCSDVRAATIRLPLVSRSYLARRNANYSTQLYNDAGSEYLVVVGIGTPPQNFTVALDTGSADLWVPAEECPQDVCPLTRFDAKKSTSFNATETNFSITYGIGHARGRYAFDTVELAGARVDQQAFGLVSTTVDIILPGIDFETLTPSYEAEAANGILGLGYPDLTAATTAYDPFVFRLAKEGLIEAPVFSVAMGSMYDFGWSGDLLLGGIDHSKYKDELMYLPVIKVDGKFKYWAVEGKAVHLGSDLNADLQGRGLIIDTGTTLTYMDRALAETIVKQVTNDGGVVFDEASGVYLIHCQSYKSPLRLMFEFPNNIKLNVSMADLVIPLDADHAKDATQCMFGVAPWTEHGSGIGRSDMILVGDSVLRSVYLVFDMSQNRIGFAPAADSPTQAHVNTRHLAKGASSGSIHGQGMHPVFLSCVFIVFWNVLL